MFANKYNGNNKKNRVIALVVLASVLFVVLFSSFYIAEEADHECSGASCPVCAMIQQCADNIRQTGIGQIVTTIIAMVICFFCQTTEETGFTVLRETPVTRKVRLND